MHLNQIIPFHNKSHDGFVNVPNDEKVGRVWLVGFGLCLQHMVIHRFNFGCSMFQYIPIKKKKVVEKTDMT